MSNNEQFRQYKVQPVNNGLDNGSLIDPEGEAKSLQIIYSIRSKVQKLEGEIGCFKGHFRNQEYQRLDEMLLRQMETLNAVDGSTISEAIRKEKRRLINYIKLCEKALESKVVYMKKNNGC